jgi:uncharacterized protein YfaP (DUF2135 family)
MTATETENISTERTISNTDTTSGTKVRQIVTFKTETTSRTNEINVTGVTDYLDNINSLRSRPYYSTTTIKLCPNQCWCGYSYNYINNCECNCSFALSETPHVFLTWDKIGSDLDLYVVDPNGEVIYSIHRSSSSGGKLFRDATTGPNAFELISWGLIQDSIIGPNGNYKIYAKGVRSMGRTFYNIAVLENRDQNWNYLNGTISTGQRQLVYEFNINNDQSSSLNTEQSANFSGVCGLIYNADCECGFDNDCNCACQIVTRPAMSFDTTIYSTLTTTPCPNQCWCGLSYNYLNNCECNCSFALSETPHIILTWNDLGSDLDLYVEDPNGEQIYYSRQSSSGGKFLRDRTSGPNAVEFISWGLIQDGIKGPNGNYKIYARSYRSPGRTEYNVAVLESPNQDWKYINGKVSHTKTKLIYEFNINNDQSSSLNTDQTFNFIGVCGLIYNADCDCGFDINCNCACQLVTRSTVSYSFETTSIIETTVTPDM